VNCKRKSRRRFFLLVWPRTPPISSEFRGGVWTTQTPPLGTPLEQTWLQLSHISHYNDRQTVDCVGKNFVFVIAFRSNLPSPPKLLRNMYHGFFPSGWNLCISYLKNFCFSQIFQMNVVHTNRPRPLHLQYLPCHFTGLISHLFHII